jgi:formylglycine-generating enzyme required for sulfatase activity
VPLALLANTPPSDHPVNLVTYEEALNFAEHAGKRLPDEFEYEFAATNGGVTEFPWGNQADMLSPWSIGPVRQPGPDPRQNPPVYGLFSNVAEWTTSGFTVYPGTPAGSAREAVSPEWRKKFADMRAVRGAPFWIVEGRPAPTDIRQIEPFYSPRCRLFFPRDAAKPDIGFRLARSVKPRFLE